jgi:hypothetical protein
MKENVGTVDRIARTVVGPALLAIGYTRWGGDHGQTSGLLAMGAGLLLVETAITRVCPLNAVLGMDTREHELVEDDVAEQLKQVHLGDIDIERLATVPGR